jgi:coenzyme F420-0:L-glutamate ligase / coenzyme F420-1:gamma-L-glutamate ligase
MAEKIHFIPITGLPVVQPGDDLADLLLTALSKMGETLQNGDVIALAQKIVSKSEGQLINLAGITAGELAHEIAPLAAKDPRHVEVILRESKQIIWVSPGIFVVETYHGYVCANAGVDRSNIEQEGNGEILCLLPRNPDASAANLRATLEKRTGVKLAVIINDTHGRPFRMGGVGVLLGASGIVALHDERGQTDMFGYRLQATLTAMGDELAAATSLVMGQSAQGVPAVIVRGLSYERPDPDLGAKPLIRPGDKDVFRYPPGSDTWRARVLPHW